MTDRMRWLSLAGALAGIAAIIAVILVVVQPPQALDGAGVPDDPVTPQTAPTPDVAAAASPAAAVTNPPVAMASPSATVASLPVVTASPRQPRQARQ